MDRKDDQRSRRRIVYTGGIMFAWTALILFLVTYEVMERRDQDQSTAFWNRALSISRSP